MAMRIDKFLTQAGVGSRSEVKKYVKNKRISVNGEVISDSGIHIEADKDIICFDNTQITCVSGFRYYILNKPAGVITATNDNFQKTVLDLFPVKLRKNLSPVGRLDKDTVGLLLLTDDGNLSHRLLSPKHHIPKQYYLETDTELSDDLVEKFLQGVDIGDDKPCKSAELIILENRKSALLTIYEGRFHQVKRMLQAFGRKVVYLKRESMGSLKLPQELKEGEFRTLTEEEIRCLQA